MNLTRGTNHHDQSVKDVQSMVNVMEDFGNPFEEESRDLLVLDTNEIAPPAAADALRHAHKEGQRHCPRTACGENETRGRYHP